jgi:UDP-glucose 4-epimerase
MPTVLVTGGAGFIGSHLCEALLARGDEVVVLDDLSSSSRDNLARVDGEAALDVVVGSVLDEDLVDALAARCALTVHLASAVGVRMIVDDPVRSVRTIVGGTDAVLRAALRHRHHRVLLASSSEVYGRNPLPLDEDADRVFGPTTVNRWSYGTAKAVDEFLAFGFWSRHGLPTVVARLFNTVGPRQSPAYGMVLPRLVDQALAGEDLTVYGDGTQTRTFCHVLDAVPALLALLDHPDTAGRPFNVGSTEEVAIGELARRIIERTGSRARIRWVPYTEAYGAEFEETDRRRPVTDRIRATLGWTPSYSLDDIIDSIVDTRVVRR